MYLSTSYHASELNPEQLTLDCHGHAQEDLRSLIAERLERDRAVYLRNTGMTALREMSAWADFVGIRQMDYEGGTGSRYDLGDGVLSVGTEPAHTNIDPHCEMSYWRYFPRYVMFGCEWAPKTGGETVIASNQLVSAALDETDTGRRIFERGIRYIRNFTDRENPASLPSIANWQDSFDCSDYDEVERRCAAQQWQCERRADGSVKISYPEQGFEFDEKSGRHLLFTSMARLGRAFDEWPPYNQLDNQDRPYDVCYADGSPFSERDLATLDQAYSRYTLPLQWRPGDIAVLENIAWTHSRPPYRLAADDERKIGILVSDHQPRLRQRGNH